MSKKRAAEFSVADLRAQVRHKVIVQRLFDQFVAINVDNLRGNTRTLESWLVANYGLQVTYGCVSFLKSHSLFCAEPSLREVQANRRGGFCLLMYLILRQTSFLKCLVKDKCFLLRFPCVWSVRIPISTIFVNKLFSNVSKNFINVSKAL